MKISGFIFVRDAVKFDYPIVETITSVLPLCDGCIALLANSDDGNRDVIDVKNHFLRIGILDEYEGLLISVFSSKLYVFLIP